MTAHHPVLIVGAGFSGTMVALHLAARNIGSRLIDPADRPARGAAYSTRDPAHLLNVRAANMSAFPDRPDDFARHVADRGLDGHDFASRRDYGDYLAAKLDDAVAGGLVELVAGSAVSARRADEGWTVTLADGRRLAGAALVLAIGNAPPGPLANVGAIDPDDLLNQPWRPESTHRLHAAADRNEPVLIVGTGLTMIDALLSLDGAGHRGPIVAVSRRGLLPRAHADIGPSALAPPTLDEVPATASGLVRWLRQRADAEGEWRRAIDSLRPLTQALWQRMDRAERARFLHHGRAWWDVHRHRVAPDVAARVSAMIAAGRLRVVAGRLLSSERTGTAYAVTIARRDGGRERVEAGLVVNCTGPMSRLRDHPDPLVAQMLDDGLLRADGLELGAEVDACDRLAGHRDAYAIGPIARGRYWEMTAVPDIRVKAAELAGAIAADLAQSPLACA